MKKTVQILFFILITLSVFTGIFIYQSKLQTNKKTEIKQLITVYFKLADQKDFTKQEIIPGKNALDLTKKIATVVIKGEGVNAYVTTINGREAKSTNKEFWAFYVNGKQAIVGAGSYQLKNGDKIEWKIEKY